MGELFLERHDPVTVLRRKVRKDAGQQVAMADAVKQALLAQYAAHKGWSVQFHYDNLVALAATSPEIGAPPSYSTVRRFMKAHGLFRRRRVTSARTPGALAAEARLEELEVRSYEAAYVNGLWHWDCHVGSTKVVTPGGELVAPVLFGALDDRSRVACHVQWYWAENSENIAHGLSQAIQKRGLPRSALSDNGTAMTSAEIAEGLERLGVIHETTLPPARLHKVRGPQSAPQRRHGEHRGPPFRGAQPLPGTSSASPSATRPGNLRQARSAPRGWRRGRGRPAGRLSRAAGHSREILPDRPPKRRGVYG